MAKRVRGFVLTKLHCLVLEVDLRACFLNNLLGTIYLEDELQQCIVA
jgi:hypothetical protein